MALYALISYLLVLRCRHYAREFAAARRTVSGRIVNSVTNIILAKLFARRTYWFMEKIRWFRYTAAMLLMLGITDFALKVWSESDMSTGEFAMAATLPLLLIEKAPVLSRQFLAFGVFGLVR